jgi:hypothetical protein
MGVGLYIHYHGHTQVIFRGSCNKLSPLGLLAVSAITSVLGLYYLSYSAGFVIIISATICALGKTFFWGTMLGVVAEQFPRGGKGGYAPVILSDNSYRIHPD